MLASTGGVSLDGQSLDLCPLSKSTPPIILATFGQHHPNILRAANQDTAILLFSRSAAVESTLKPLAGHGKAQSIAIARYLIQQVSRVTRQSQLPVFCIEESQQYGDGFGERFANAFEQLFALGFAKVVSVGNDCPNLTVSDLKLAAQKLDSAPAVFGPAKDGGAYLVGLRREAFEKAKFAALQWQTAHTLASLKTYALGCFSLLSEKADIDSCADLRRVLESKRLPIALKIRLLNAIRFAFPTWYEPSAWVPGIIGSPGFLLRGPPRMAQY